jgi:hypothetical protein
MEKLTKELAEKLMNIQGEARGIHFKNDAEYILNKKGEKGLKKVEAELKKLGFPLDYQKVRNLEFYPAGLRALSLLAAQKTFGWDDEEIRKMCSFAAGASFIVKLYIKFFYSVPKLLSKAALMWREYWTRGELKVEEYNKKKRYVVIKIQGIDIHPVYCRCLEGYFKSIAKMANKSEKTSCREIECSFKEGEGHKFLIKY